ncbi:hypothetical protein VTK73DRAFT_2609 [Phialemonium thermophilum]|uniref:Uncharacterized protein n=1 Tax=Phialemonium thermophilum TaxID=223376 RepID=A0ABR3X3Y7_9PEZI
MPVTTASLVSSPGAMASKELGKQTPKKRNTTAAAAVQSPSSNKEASGAAGKSTALPSTGAPPGYHAARRATTVDDATELRRRSWTNQFTAENLFDTPRRRSSTYSEYSLNEAQRNLQEDILNPSGASLVTHENSNWAAVPLAFAILPAIAGLFFKNGGSVITDAMLLGLAAIFLHWSVTQPWNLYRSAQEIRVAEETDDEFAIDDDGDDDVRPSTPESTPKRPPGSPAGSDGTSPGGESSSRRAQSSRQEALGELYKYEVIALASCFLFPLLGAFLLHAIRNQLSRPSEGLVSNFNLTIFLLAAEIHPLGHLIKLVQARTLHLQRTVHANPYKDAVKREADLVEGLAQRLSKLESRIGPDAAAVTPPASARPASVDLVREVRSAVQPDLDALSRAIRHYEKRTTVLAFHTESRLNAMDRRLRDAISLAAAAAKSHASQRGVLSVVVERVAALCLAPFYALFGIVTLPFRALLSSSPFNRARDRAKASSPRAQKGGRLKASRSSV